jgi:thiol:disulfide interchange protein DsbC
VKKSIDLGHKLAITGTPTLFFADGERIQGVIPPAQIEKKLDQISP